MRTTRRRFELRNQQVSLVELAKPALKTLERFISSSQIPPAQSIRSVLGVKAHPDWVYDFSIADLMFIQPLEAEDLQRGLGVSSEFSKDSLIYKVCLLAVSYFCCGTELRYLNNENKMPAGKSVEKTFAKSLELLKAFWPVDSLLVMHIVESCEKKFEETLQEIVRSK